MPSSPDPQNDRKPQPYPALPAGRRSCRARSRRRRAGAGDRPDVAADPVAGAGSRQNSRAWAAAGRRRGECQPGFARASVAVVCARWCRRGAETRSRGGPWDRLCRRSRGLRAGNPAGDGRDVSARKPADIARRARAVTDNPFSLWVYLSQSPLLWLTVTLLVYAVADAVSLWTRRHPLANPVLHSMWIIGAFLLLTGTSYSTYFGGAQFVHFLLGPATVALAVPLYENRKVVAA